MIIIRLMGGLGNQMFQYSLGRRLSLERNLPLKLDLSWFGKQTLRQYRLDKFNIQAEIALPADLEHFTLSYRRDLVGRFFRLYQSCLPYNRRKVFAEHGSSFDPAVFQTPKQVYLIGYWQSERYFKPIGDALRQDFELKNGLDPEFWSMAEQIQAGSSVSVHVRRGDYVSNPHTNSYHGTCSPEYYQTAIRYIKSKFPASHFFVFSDDPFWVQENLGFITPSTIILDGRPDQDVQHLNLMSQCKHHIIANSSFSWWGAWLNSNPEKIVLSPEKWLNDGSRDTKDLIPESWVKIRV